MATTKVVLELDVQGEELQQLNAELEKTEKNFKDVQKEAGKANKSVDDVASNGGAIAILDQLTGGLATRLRDAYEASKLFNTSLKATRGALLATGIGALVVALGTIVVYWEEISDWVQGVNVDLEEQNAQLDDNLKITQAQTKTIDAQIALYERQGKSVDDLIEKKKQLLKQERLENQLLLANSIQRRLALEEEASKRADLLFVLTRGLAGSRGATEEDRRKIAELAAETEGYAAAILNIALQLEELENPLAPEDDGVDRPRDLQSVGTFGQAGRLDDDGIFDARLETEAEFYDQSIEGFRQYLSEIQKASKANQVFEEQVNLARIGLAKQTFGLLGELAGENQALQAISIIGGNAASIAEIIQQTAIANAKSIAASPLTGGQPFVGFNTASAVLSIASVGAATAKALSELGGSGGGSTAGLPQTAGGGGGAIPQPQFNVVGDAGINSVAEAIQGQQNEPVRAYVAIQDINTAQDMERNTVQGSTV